MEQDRMGNWREHRHTPPSEISQNALFSELVPSITRTRNKAIDPNVLRIDLGEIHHLLDSVWDFAVEDSKSNEYLVNFYLDEVNKLKFFPVMHKGDSHSVHQGIQINRHFESYSAMVEVEHHVGILHTHSLSDSASIPSFQDLGVLLQEWSDYEENDLFILVIGNKGRSMVFRGQNTPILTKEQFNFNLHEWNRIVKQKKLYFNGSRENNGLRFKVRQASIVEDLYRRVIKDYDLQYFVGSHNSPFFDKIDPDKVELE
jgi:hypothetical protein